MNCQSKLSFHWFSNLYFHSFFIENKLTLIRILFIITSQMLFIFGGSEFEDAIAFAHFHFLKIADIGRRSNILSYNASLIGAPTE